MLYVLIFTHGLLSGFAGPLSYDVSTCRERIKQLAQQLPMRNPEQLDAASVRFECRTLIKKPRVVL